ncbi:MAG: FmdB family zinc ribbon protein [bacterium]
MPTYEYECLVNGHRFEEFQSMTEDPIETCPVCGGEVRRLISAGAGILFKGQGFYQTDYRSPSYQKAARAEKEGESSGRKEKESSPKKSGAGPAAGGEG